MSDPAPPSTGPAAGAARPDGLRVCVDLERLAANGDHSALTTGGAQIHWSPDRQSCAICVVEPGAGNRCSDARIERAARSWLAAYAVAPGRWPDVSHVDAAGVIVDFRRAEILAGIDRMGLHGLYWSLDGSMLRIASRLADVMSPARPPRIDPAAVYCYVYFHFVPSPLAIFAGAAKLPRAHVLHWRTGKLDITRYRLETFVEHAPPTIADELAPVLLDALRSAVSSRMDGEAAIGAFLSGGLDSSTVAGLMSQRLGGNGDSFSIGFDATGYDEMEYARIAVRRFGLQAHEHYMTPEDTLASTPRLLRGTDEPFGNASLAAAYQCALIAREAGISRLLAGDGGDELFAGNERYATQVLFERYFRIPAPLRRAVLEPLVMPLGQAFPGTPLGKAARYIEQANAGLPDRLQSYNYLHRHAPEEVFSGRFLDSVDTGQPLALWRAEFAAPRAADTVDRMLFLDWAYTLHDNDLVKVNTACRAAGMAVAYPMLDDALVDIACRLPGSLKMRGRELRWFYKHATRTLLPAEIIGKKKHGFGLPFGVWTRTHPGLRRLSESALESLATRGIFRPEFLQQAVHLHRESHATYYGVLVWVLMALELWIDANAPPSNQAW